MPTAEAKKEFYESGFPKTVTRGKYNLPINERLKTARNFKKMSSAQVVAKLKQKGIKIGQSTLQGYEADESSLNHRYPPLPSLVALADFYNCSMDFLFGYTDKIEKPKSHKKRKIELDKELITGENILYEGRKLSDKQLQMIKDQIEYILE
jgi:transcriptional regulator with XRE-family HTH domain